MANSSTVAALDDILAGQYNNLRLDVLDATSGHDHDGTEGKKVNANDLSGTTLASGVTASSLTSVGTLTSLAVSGTRSVDGRVVKSTIYKAVTDNVATDTFTITSSGNDGGTYTCIVRGLVVNGVTGSGFHARAAKSFSATFAAARTNNGGSKAVSAVTELWESASAATNASSRDVGTVTMTVVNTSDSVSTIQFLVDNTGTDASAPELYLDIEVIWQNFTAAPTIAVS